MKRARSIGIHDGTFHADEVTACALLIVFDLADYDKIVRTRNFKILSECEFVCDVGGIYSPVDKLFDHHQVSYQGEHSSAGMILEYLKSQRIISHEIYSFFNNTLIWGVDEHDNGRAPQTPGYCTFSHIIANYNPIFSDSGEKEVEDAFREALVFTIGHLRRLYSRYLYSRDCRNIVKKAMDSHKLCLFFDKPIAWLESFFALNGKEHPALFVIMPAKEHWKLRGIPPDYEHRMEVRYPLPDSWAGLLGEELKKASNISGAIFCHKGRFTSVWETKEDAIAALKKVLEINKISYSSVELDENSI